LKIKDYRIVLGKKLYKTNRS